MHRPIPYCSPGLWPDGIPAGRFASRIASTDPSACRVALIGLPDDLGVRLNGGRPGAAEGPSAFRAALARYGAAEPCGWVFPAVFDAGDVTPAEGDGEPSLHETHRRVTVAVRAVVEAGLLPIGIGGGHDLTFPFVRGVIEHRRAAASAALVEGVYIDAHLDVRETVGSGMPFRALIDSCGVTGLDLFGFSPFANTPEHLAWFNTHGGCVHDRTAWTPPRGAGVSRFVSLDLDAIDASAAPGVSADNPCGLSPRDVAGLVLAAGRAKDVMCFDVMELNPSRDHQQRTARLAAHLVLTFLRGLAERWGVGA